MFGSQGGIVTVTGHAVHLRVRLRSLWIEDGFKNEGEVRRRTLTRAQAPIDRVLFLAGSGFITVSALDWCAENGAPIVAVDQSGETRWTLAPGRIGEMHAKLRRAQALAPFTEAGIEIARWLIGKKIAEQEETLRDLSRTSTNVKAGLPDVERARSLSQVRTLEAQAADAYWNAWKGLPLHFAPPSYAKTVPAHWTAYRGRGSPLTDGPRAAVDPVNALLNYAYALLEAEARIALVQAGLDPYLGILHTDQDARRSLVYDVMEPIRPVADRLVLDLVTNHAFRPGELWALRDGRCRLDQDFCAWLWKWMPQFRAALGPVMTFLLGRLRQGPTYGERTAFRIVETTPEVRTRAPLGQKRWARNASLPPIHPAGVCRSCGVLLEGLNDRLYCDDCLPSRRKDAGASELKAGRDMLGRLRQHGRDPAHGGKAARSRGKTIGRHNRERARWRDMGDGAVDPSIFRREILPRLSHVPLSRIAQTAGVSKGYASFIRRGLRVPHPRHWKAMRAIGQGNRSREKALGQAARKT